jgi:aminomethyltransferase
MGTTELTEKLTGLRREEYRGADTIALFSDLGAEFRALLGGTGAYDLGWRAKLLVTGRDRIRWLNGMITNNVRDLPVGQGAYSFLLTPQGRILGDLTVYNHDDFLVIDTDQSQAENLVAILRRYIIMDKVEIANAGKWAAIGLAGPKSAEVLGRIGISHSELKPLELVHGSWQDSGLIIIRGDLPKVPSYEIWMEPARLSRLWQELVNAGALPAGSEAVELFRIACGVPRYGVDIRERDLPQETEQFRALHYTKGCYIGQEIVERIRSRGAVHRKFTGFRIAGPVPAPGSKAQAEGKEIAEITSARSLPTAAGEIAVALGYVRREAGATGNEIRIAEARATVAELPFAEIFATA